MIQILICLKSFINTYYEFTRIKPIFHSVDLMVRRALSPDPEYSLQQPFSNNLIPSYPPPGPSCSYIPASLQQLETLYLYARFVRASTQVLTVVRVVIYIYIHTNCGQTVDDMEGYGCPVWCISCWVEHRTDGIQQGRLAAKRGQEKNPTDDKAIQQKDKTC